MKKKLFSLLLAMVMIIGVMPCLSVAATGTVTYVDEVDGWTVDGPKGAEADKINELEVQTATGMSYTGDNSLYIKYNCTAEATTQSWGSNTLAYTKNWVYIRNNGMTETPATDTTYTLSLYVNKIANAEAEAENNYIMFYMGNTTMGEGKTTTYHMQASTDGMDAAKVAEGWEKRTATFTNISQAFFMQLQLKGEWYIDDISLVAANNPTVNLLENGDFEPEVVEETTVTYVDGADGWTVDGPKGAEADKINELKVQTATGMSYTGDNSLHIKYNCTSDATTASWGDNTLAYTKNWAFIYNDAITEAPAADTTYTLSFYMKSIANAEAGAANNYIMFFMGNTTIGEGKTTTKHMASTTDGVNAAKAADGWKKYTATFTNISQKFNMQLQLKGEWYIDDISLVAANNPTVNLLENGDFEGTTAVEPDPVITYEDCANTDWYSAKNEANDNGVIEVCDVKIANGLGYNSSKSLFVDFESAATLNAWGGYSNDRVGIWNTYQEYDSTKSYNVSLRIKGEYNVGGIFVQMGTTTNTNKYTLKGLTAGETDSKGWTQYTTTTPITGAYEKFQIIVQTKADCYIDDIVLATTDAPTVNLLTNGDFEKFIEYAPKFVDEDGNPVAALSVDHSGQTLSASAAIIVDKTVTETAQLIVCVYDGFMLKDFNATDVTDVAEDGSVRLTCDIEIPEYESVGEYKVKAYVWDSFNGLYPLTDEVAEI